MRHSKRPQCCTKSAAHSGDAGFWESLFETTEHRKAIRQLNALSDVELRDVGLRRDDIRCAVQCGKCC